MQIKYINKDNLAKIDSHTININDLILQRQIGEGSYGKVYLVKEKKTGNVFAAKKLKDELYNINNESILDLKREVNIISKLIHPAVIKFYGYSPTNFKNNPKPVITEYAANGSLLPNMLQMDH